MKENVCIGIADDHMLVRKALRAFLTQIDEIDINVVMEAGGGNELLKNLEDNHSVDVLLLDAFMPAPCGEELLKILQYRFPHIKVLMISFCIDPEIISGFLDWGILGYISKAADPAELLAAIRSAYQCHLYENQILTKALYWKTNHLQQVVPENHDNGFSDKQKRILELLWQEKSTQEIADEVFLSVSAVDKIKQQLKEKTGARTTIGLLKFAIEKKIIKPHTLSQRLSGSAS